MPRIYRTAELVRIARGENIRLTVASDIYQLGLVLYRSLTGFNPQKATTNGDVREDVTELMAHPDHRRRRRTSDFSNPTNVERQSPQDNLMLLTFSMN